MPQSPPRPDPPSLPPVWRSLPTGIWAMGVASLCMDASSEMIHSLLPVFMVSTLGATMITVGLVEGLAEATASLMKVFSGALSDRLGHRKSLMILGYAMAAVSKPVFPLAPTVGWVFTARLVDRLGKGIRGAPRDALVADLTPPSLRGAAYGLRQALDSAGAFTGPLLAVVFMAVFANDVRLVLWVAALPAFLAVAVLVWRVQEPRVSAPSDPVKPPFTLAGARALPRSFWFLSVLGAVVTLARFSDAFIVLRAKGVGLSIGQVPLIMMVMNLLYAAAAYPAGVAADRVRPRTLLLLALGLLVSADVVLALATAPVAVFAGASLWGLHMACSQGLLSKLVAEASPPALRGTAFGLFNLITGIAVLASSLIAGSLWTCFGPSATFLAGAGFAAVAGIGLLLAQREA